ncbi:uncharacterized protein L203_100229 [Cryptococcus depauperatus CBS 7841]|uniref:Uncharacterized protein n=1 Tax=Cryptococcus depauperatus CBS 7841 TaxID=1295531 RepID=A0A1E3IZ86_9TREE|nr:hypothetical protein L203_00111 [Cryptococcus depauperatus CBS 7841]
MLLKLAALVSLTGFVSALAAPQHTVPNDKQIYLDLHNNYRAQHGASALSWNDNLASYAAKVASKCKFRHSGGIYGENLAAGVGNGYDIQRGFSSWIDESSQYSSIFPQASHFTQVVWKGSKELGCAAHVCVDGTIFSGMGQNSVFVICEYNPPGNVMNRFLENVQALN